MTGPELLPLWVVGDRGFDPRLGTMNFPTILLVPVTHITFLININRERIVIRDFYNFPFKKKIHLNVTNCFNIVKKLNITLLQSLTRTN